MAKIENLDKLMKRIVYGLYSDEVDFVYREASQNPEIRYSPVNLFTDLENPKDLSDALDYLVHLDFLNAKKLQDGRTVYSLSGKKTEQVRKFWFSELCNIMSEKLDVVVARLLAKKIAGECDESENQESVAPSFQE
ncbi:MAG: hypothetical protein ACFE7E_05145 [Candidatus Hodarchaeota archaeon]